MPPFFINSSRLSYKRAPLFFNPAKLSNFDLYLRYVTSASFSEVAGYDAVSTFGSLTGTAKWYGGVLAPNELIYGIPADSTTILKINPTNDTVSTFGSLTGTANCVGGVLAPNGMIYGIPRDRTSVLKIGINAQVDSYLLSAYVNKY